MILQILQLTLQFCRLHEQMRFAPAVVANGMVHENGDLPPEEKYRILRGNAVRLFGSRLCRGEDGKGEEIT